MKPILNKSSPKVFEIWLLFLKYLWNDLISEKLVNYNFQFGSQKLHLEKEVKAPGENIALVFGGGGELLNSWNVSSSLMALADQGDRKPVGFGCYMNTKPK